MTQIKMLLSNQRGVALMMIMTAIIILMAVYGEFTFESKISRIKATNIMDRSQAKLLAESGLQLAMARLRLYKEAHNTVENNANAKNAVPAQMLNQLWEVPFMFPIPIGKGANRAFIDTVDKFTEESLLQGEMKVTINNLANRLNLNLLRMDMSKIPADPTAKQEYLQNASSSQLDMSDNAIKTDVAIDQTLFFLLKRLVEEKKEKDEGFEDRYSALNYQELVTNLKYFVSDYQSLNTDPLAGEAEGTFQKIPLAPKYGPMGSASELYMIPGWTDELIELIQNEFSAYPNTQIDFNKITANMLKILVPNINEDEVKEFFTYRDDPEAPKFINKLEDFKAYVVNRESLMSSADFDTRMELFQKRGFTFGSSPNFFKVVSEGTYNRSVYTLIAFVLLPKQETAGSTTNGSTSGGTSGGSTTGPSTNGSGSGSTSGGSTGGGQTGGQTSQLLEPRIIEIQIN